MYGLGFGISSLRSCHTGAGSLYGGSGRTVVVGIAGTMGPLFVFQSTRIAEVNVRKQVTSKPFVEDI